MALNARAEKIMQRYLSACLFLFSLSSFNALCAINKWVDDSGRVHYSDQQPPEDTQSTLLGNAVAASGIAASDVSAPKSWVEREVEFKKARKAKTEAAQKAAKQQVDADAKQKYCLDTRNSLTSMEKSPRVVTYNANGERTYLDDAARQQRIHEMREAIEANCS